MSDRDIHDALERMERRIRAALYLVWLTLFVTICIATAAILTAVGNA